MQQESVGQTTGSEPPDRRGGIPGWVPVAIAVPLLLLCAGGVAALLLLRRPPAIRSFSFEPAMPAAGEPVTVHWAVDNAQRVELRPVAQDLDPRTGQYTIAGGLPAATTLTLIVTNPFGSAERSIAVPVAAAPPAPTVSAEPGAPVIEDWAVSPLTVNVGDPVTIRWRVSHAELVTLQPLGSVGLSGEVELKPQATTTYKLTASNEGRTAERSQQVIVNVPATAAPSPAPSDTVAPAPSATATLRPSPTPTLGLIPLPLPLTLVPLPLATPTPTPFLVPFPFPITVVPLPGSAVVEHDYDLLDKAQYYRLQLTAPGVIRAEATWSGTQTNLALIINGPGQVGYYARSDGPSGTSVSYNVTAADLAAGRTWVVSIVSFGAGNADGTVEITYPSGSTTSPFRERFIAQPGDVRVTDVVVVKRAGPLEALTTWSGTPVELTMFINGPGQVGYYARTYGASPLSAAYTVTAADVAAGDTWRVSVVSYSAADVHGNMRITYPAP